MVNILRSLLFSATLIAGDIVSWIEKDYPSELSKTMALAAGTSQLLANAGGRNIVLILPTNAAWEKHKSLYDKLMADKSLSLSLIVDAAVEVPKPVKSLKDIPKSDVLTVGGTPIVVDPKDKEGKTVYFGEYKSDGSVAKVGKPIKLKSKPVATFDNITIFEATSFATPPSLRATSSVSAIPNIG